MAEAAAATILLVEDDPGHARLIERNLRRNRVHHEIVQIPDGQSALDYLYSRGDYQNQPRPDRLVVLLDLNLPRLDGYQVLRHLKADPFTQKIPVVVLTTTEDAREVDRCYELGCSIFLTKPVNYTEFSDTLRRLGELLSVVKVPSGCLPP
ncbi:MAG: response regulator [Acidobacteria bacterium]|nr:response regulator [Acidobacteriota bacterium]